VDDLNGNQWTDGTERENSLGRNTQGEDLGQDRIEFQGSGGCRRLDGRGGTIRKEEEKEERKPFHA
jgi:hypothetical protein